MLESIKPSLYTHRANKTPKCTAVLAVSVVQQPEGPLEWDGYLSKEGYVDKPRTHATHEIMIKFQIWRKLSLL